jgi:transcriptional regulator GlxA family with amidase domain
VNFGVFIYDGTEPIDLATFGVLSMARRIEPRIAICTIAPTSAVVALANGLRVIPDFDIASAPRLDVLIITGGPGWTAQSRSREVLDFIRARAGAALIASVCTGSMLLAASGLLDGKRATTKCEVAPPEISPLEIMRENYPRIDVCRSSLVAHDRIITGGGVSLCIDTTLYLLEKLFGRDVAAETARIIEYQRAWSANLDQFPATEVECAPRA